MRMPLFLAAAVAAAVPETARAELILSQLIVELQPGKASRQDIEVRNTDSARAYVAVEPRQVLDAGQPTERRVGDPDPEKLGLLVSPARMILEPGQHKLLRFADIAPPSDLERVYRVTVKPVAGGINAEESGLKILVGYDVLVLVRPSKPVPNVTAVRTGRTITWRNDGNVSAELTDGKQCEASSCVDLPGKRLYPRASWSVDLPKDGKAEYLVRTTAGITKRRL